MQRWQVNRGYKASSWRRFGRSLAVLLFLAFVIGGVAIFRPHTHAGPIPSSITKQLAFTLYYPYNLPTGYSVDLASFQTKDGSLIFSIKTPTDKNIAVSEQAVPHNGDQELGPPDTPSGSPVNTTKHYDVPAGKAVIGLWGSNFVSSIVAGQTWLLLNASGFTYDQTLAVSRSFSTLH